MTRPALFAALALGALLPAEYAAAQEKKADKKDAPAVNAIVPLAVAPGETAKVRLRGAKLDVAKAVRVVEPTGAGVRVELKNKGKAEAKDDAAKKAGDTQVEVELTVPKEFTGDAVKLVVVTPDGDAPPASVQVVAGDRLVDEKESNGGLRNAQPVDRPGTVRGTVGEEKDVDVYRVAGRAGQTLRAAVRAGRLGSALDATLTVYDARGRVLATADDAADGRDPSVEAKLPADGDYYVALADAHDRGGSGTHGYLLDIRW
jgi:hypothetical protein